MTWNPPDTTARGRATVLRTNYRNTREILDPALAVLRLSTDTNSSDADADGLDVLVMPEDAVRHGIATAILACADLRAEADCIAAKVQELRRSGAETDHTDELIPTASDMGSGPVSHGRPADRRLSPPEARERKMRVTGIVFLHVDKLQLISFDLAVH